MTAPPPKPINVLLVDDDECDIMLTTKALSTDKLYSSLSVARDGVEALEFLRREGKFADAPRPDLILLDLNMPRMDGRETLTHLKSDDDLKTIPVVVLTTSEADKDIMKSYDLQASCYLTKPVDLTQFTNVVRTINDFWFCVVRYPNSKSATLV